MSSAYSIDQKSIEEAVKEVGLFEMKKKKMNKKKNLDKKKTHQRM